MRSSTYYRARAERCRLSAAKSRSQRMTNRLLQMASEFEHLAAAHEARGSSTYYRGRAQRCRLLATKSKAQHTTARLLAMAIEYERLAAIAEARRVQAARDETSRPEPDS
jgi:hypothetical protein